MFNIKMISLSLPPNSYIPTTETIQATSSKLYHTRSISYINAQKKSMAMTKWKRWNNANFSFSGKFLKNVETQLITRSTWKIVQCIYFWDLCFKLIDDVFVQDMYFQWQIPHDGSLSSFNV